MGYRPLPHETRHHPSPHAVRNSPPGRRAASVPPSTARQRPVKVIIGRRRMDDLGGLIVSVAESQVNLQRMLSSLSRVPRFHPGVLHNMILVNKLGPPGGSGPWTVR